MRGFLVNVFLGMALISCSIARAGEVTGMGIDLSLSMSEGGKSRTVEETLKLVLTILNGKVHLVTFDDRSTTHPALNLASHANRQAALAQYPRLKTQGNTNYVAMLEAFERLNLPPATDVIILSDGLPTVGGDKSMILAKLKRMNLKLHTVAIQASGDAKALLREMAEVTGGQALTANDSKELLRHLISLAFDLGDYMVYTPRDVSKEFQGTFGGGSILAIGFDQMTEVDGIPQNDPVLSVTAELPGEHVSIKRIELTELADLHFRMGKKRSPSAVIAKVLRNDAKRYQPEIANSLEKTVAAGRMTEFKIFPLPAPKDARGQVLPQREPEVTMRLREPETGRTLDQAKAVPVKDRSGALVSRLEVPAVVNKQMLLDQIERLDDADGTGERVTTVPLKTTWVKSNGLKTKQGKSINLGTQFANAGKVALGPITIESLDDSTIAYAVTLDDLTGEAAAIPVSLTQTRITPSMEQPAQLIINANIGSLSAGEYAGILTCSSPVVEKDFALSLTLTIQDPLSAALAAPVAVKPGMIAKAKLEIVNAAAGAIGKVDFEANQVKVAGGFISLVPPQSTTIAGKSKQNIELRIEAAPGITDRGKLTIPLRIDRNGVRLLTVPIEVSVSDSVPAGFACSPKKLTIKGERDSIAAFQLRIQPSDQVISGDALQANAGSFQDPQGMDAEIAFDLPIPKPGKLTTNQTIEIKGRVLLPRQPGAYLGTITLESDLSGSVDIPVQLNVN